MKQTVEEAAYQNEQKMLIDADIGVSEEEESYYEGLRDGIMESASKSFIAGAEWQTKQSPWINVKDRLPEENEKVFFVLLFRGIHKEMLSGVYREYKWETERRIYKSSSFDGVVTHWMPIPKFNE